MPLAAGTRLGPDEIVAPVGVWGTVGVCRAQDTKLQRDVAVETEERQFSSLGGIEANRGTDDGESYYYSCIRNDSDLYLVGGLR
jgi:hypothetical protein